MELWQIIIFCLILLAIVAGGYVFMYFHILRTDPRELEFRKHLGQDNGLIPRKDKKKEKEKEKK